MIDFHPEDFKQFYLVQGLPLSKLFGPLDATESEKLLLLLASIQEHGEQLADMAAQRAELPCRTEGVHMLVNDQIGLVNLQLDLGGKDWRGGINFEVALEDPSKELPAEQRKFDVSGAVAVWCNERFCQEASGVHDAWKWFTTATSPIEAVEQLSAAVIACQKAVAELKPSALQGLLH